MYKYCYIEPIIFTSYLIWYTGRIWNGYVASRFNRIGEIAEVLNSSMTEFFKKNDSVRARPDYLADSINPHLILYGQRTEKRKMKLPNLSENFPLVHLKKRDKRACKKKSPLESVSKRLNFLVRPTRIELVAYSLGVHTASVVWDNVCWY